MLKNFIYRVSDFGTNSNLPNSINRQIMLCNQIALSMLVLTLLFTIANAMRFDVMKILTSVCNTCIFVLVIFLNKYQYHLAGRLLACLVILISNTLSQILARIYYPQDIFITQYFGDRIFILASSLFPLLLFNPKREKRFFGATYLIILALLMSYDLIHWLLGIEIHRANIPQYLQGYSFINLTFFVVTVGISLAIVFLKNMSLLYESQIIQANKELESQKEEILTQNAELQEQQHEITAQRDYIEEQHNQTKNSIRVAHTIQQAILPTQERLATVLQHYFVLYMPRDVVSGDFYWVSQVQDWKILVVADCTGHGVPGAFMTLIAHTLLDKIVNIWGINEPHIILQKLHEDVVIALNQEAHSNNMGMDALVLAWKPHEADDFMLKFEGGKIDMHYVLPTHKQVDTLRATRKSIGGEQNEHKIFTTKILVLPAYTQIYVGSDGLLDQNDARRRRLGLQALSQVILQNAPLPISEQQKALQAMLADYMQGTFQRDDILWIGFRL